MSTMTNEEKDIVIEELLKKRKQKSLGDKIAKKITLSILVGAFLFGIAGTIYDSIDMIKYIDFLDAFTWYFSTLILSIGVGSGAGKIAKGFGQNKKDD